MTPDEDVEDVPLIRPCASRQVVLVPLVLEVPVILPWASRKVVLPLLDCVAVPVILPWVSLKVVLVPEVLAVVEDLPFSSLRLAFLPAREEAGSAEARMGNRRARTSFMRALDEATMKTFTAVHNLFAQATASRTCGSSALMSAQIRPYSFRYS